MSDALLTPLHKRQVYPYIDILRGFAALSVLIYHVIEQWQWKDWPINGPLVWFRAGWMGVVLLSLKELTWLEPMQALIYGVILTLLLASFSWHLFEKPLLERSKNYLDRPGFFNRFSS